MKLTVYLSDGKPLKIKHFDASTAFDLREALADEQFLTFEVGEATVIVNRDRIVRIDFEESA